MPLFVRRARDPARGHHGEGCHRPTQCRPGDTGRIRNKSTCATGSTRGMPPPGGDNDQSARGSGVSGWPAEDHDTRTRLLAQLPVTEAANSPGHQVMERTSLRTLRVDTDGAQLEIRARGEGEPVVFIHGSMPDECAAVVKEPALVKHFRVIDYHRRGWGRQSPAVGPVSIGQGVEDCKAILRHLRVERAHFAGQSSGGAVVLQLALDVPQPGKYRRGPGAVLHRIGRHEQFTDVQ